MVSQTLVIGAQRKQLLHMFYLRGPFGFSKSFCFVVVLFSSIFVLATCEQCTVKEVQNRCGFGENFDSPDVIQNVCHPSNSFCFPSTLSRCRDGISSPESEALDASKVQSEGFVSELSQLPYHGNFRFLGGGRNISCSFYQEEGFPEFSSSCLSPLFDNNTLSSAISVGPTENHELSFTGGLSPPPVEIKPSLLDYGRKNMYHPSVAYLTVKNLDSDSFLSIYEPYSDNSQFYPCGCRSKILAPGENASICFIFLPTDLGISSAKLIIQTSFGGFLIHASGFSVESPYLINPLSGLEISTNGRWRKNVSLFNPFDEALQVEEVTAWVSTFSGNSTSQSSKFTCQAHGMKYSSDYNMPSLKDWFAFNIKPEIALRPHKNWLVGSKKMETVLELDIPGHFKGKFVGALCMKLLRPANHAVETVLIPIDAELSLPESALGKGLVSLSLKAFVQRNVTTNGSIGVVLSVRNHGPYSLRVIKVTQVGENIEAFKVKPVEGLVVFPSTTTQVAFISCYAHLRSHDVKMDCKIIVWVNDTRFSEMEIPCMDVIGVCAGGRLDSFVGYGPGINVDYINGDRFITMRPSSGIKVVDTTEPDDLILQNWKSQAKVSMMSLLDKGELIFPIILVGNYSSQWISIRNPSPKPIAMQLILNSGQAIHNCRTPETLLQPSSSNTLVGNNNSIAPTRYGFSLPKDAITEAFIHSYSSATLGPILFQPSNRCDWRSSVLIRNNLSGVEWLPLQASGGSLSLVLHEGYEYDPVQSLEFKLNLPTRLNFSSPETLSHSTGVEKASYCSESLMKEVYAKNTGDLPLEVTRIKVSGAECGLDGFIVNNCTGFILLPGESVRLHISFTTDFTAATVHRDLELVLTAGIVVVPMKASTPLRLFNFCRRSIFWARVKKATAMLLFGTSLVYFVLSLFFSHVTTVSASQDFLSGDKISFSSGLTGTVGSKIVQDEALLMDQSAVSSPSSVLNMDMQDTIDLTVRVGREKGRRRRKKKSSGIGVLLFDASSSQSGNSTPSSPLSPSTWTTTPKVIETKNPFSRSPLEQSDASKCSKASSNEVPLKCKTDNPALHTTQEKPCLTRKAAGKPIFAPSASFPSTARPRPTWTCRSSLLGPTSGIAPHARAPGTKLASQESDGCKEKMGVEKNDYTYDIWGDHLFGLPSACESKKVSSWPSSPVGDDSESFFVRGPQSLVKNCMLQSVISDIGGNE